MLTKKDYCDYDTCVALKELGYVGSGEDGCRHGVYEGDGINYFYDDLDNSKTIPQECLRVHLYSAQKWLREERNIDILPRRGCITNDKQRYQVVIYINYNRNQILLDNDGEDYSSPEEALSEGIKEAVKILKER